MSRPAFVVLSNYNPASLSEKCQISMSQKVNSRHGIVLNGNSCFLITGKNSFKIFIIFDKNSYETKISIQTSSKYN